MLRLRAIGAPARAATIGALVAALVTLPGLGAGTLWDNSETAYGEVAREILLTHDWVIMHLNNAPYFVQPPLYFWIGALFAMQFGITAFALRLSSALATIALSAFTGYAVARQAGGRVGAYAAVILSTCLMQVVIGRLAIMDALLDLTVALAILWWFRGLESGRDRYFVFGSIAAGLGFLAKGPVAPVAALLVIVPYYLWNRRAEPTKLPTARAWALGLIVFSAVVIPWPAAVASRDGLGALRTLIGEYTVGRYLGVIENQAGPIWYYLPVIMLAFFPWIAFFPAAVVYAVRRLRGGASHPAEQLRLLRLSFVWIVAPLLFFSFARTKLPNYVALEFPALAIVTAIYFDGLVRRGATRSAALSAAIVPVTIGALALAIVLFTRNNRLTAEVAIAVPPLVGMALAIFGGSVLTAWLVAHARTVRAAPYALAVACVIAVDVVAVTVFPHAEVFKPVPRLAAFINRERRPGDVVAIQGVSGGNALLFYTRPEVRTLAPPNDGDPQLGALDPRTVICHATRAWVVVPASHAAEGPTYGRHRRIVAVDRTTALFLYDGSRCR